MPSRIAIALLLVLPALGSCAGVSHESGTAVPRPALGAASATDLPGLHNVVAYAPDLLCGGAPDGAAAFATLRELGVRTIVSVDGAVPDVAAARAHGLRYVHLPIGYDGMDDQRRLELARAISAMPGPIYLHCHHGRHRAAGAAAAALVTLGRISVDEGIQLMHVSGTAPDYHGLYACVERATPVPETALAMLGAEFPEISMPDDLVSAMVDLDVAVDRLRAVERASWSVPDDHPDLVPAALAGRVADLLRTLRDDPSVHAYPADFAERLAADAQLASSLEQDLLDRADPAWLSERFKQLRASCTDCHRAHRD